MPHDGVQHRHGESGDHGGAGVGRGVASAPLAGLMGPTVLVGGTAIGGHPCSKHSVCTRRVSRLHHKVQVVSGRQPNAVLRHPLPFEVRPYSYSAGEQTWLPQQLWTPCQAILPSSCPQKSCLTHIGTQHLPSSLPSSPHGQSEELLTQAQLMADSALSKLGGPLKHEETMTEQEHNMLAAVATVQVSGAAAKTCVSDRVCCKGARRCMTVQEHSVPAALARAQVSGAAWRRRCACVL